GAAHKPRHMTSTSSTSRKPPWSSTGSPTPAPDGKPPETPCWPTPPPPWHANGEPSHAKSFPIVDTHPSREKGVPTIVHCWSFHRWRHGRCQARQGVVPGQ